MNITRTGGCYINSIYVLVLVRNSGQSFRFSSPAACLPFGVKSANWGGEAAAETPTGTKSGWDRCQNVSLVPKRLRAVSPKRNRNQKVY